MSRNPPIPIADRVLAFVACGVELPPDVEEPCSHCGGHSCSQKARYWPTLQRWLCLEHFTEFTDSLKKLDEKMQMKAILEIRVGAPA